VIRPVEAADRSAIRSLQALLARADPELVDAAIDGPFVGLLAIDDTRRVGYAIGFPGDPVVLSELAVAPDFRRQGHGRSLVDAIASLAGADEIAVLTPVDNDSARQFYRDIGFEHEARLPEFYDDGTDASRLLRRE
jgi:ribosomal protein S18 acetylase RimI-like enzyme